MTETATQATEPKRISIEEFLEAVPPGRVVPVKNIGSRVSTGPPGQRKLEVRLNLPRIQLHCATEACNGVRFFAPTQESQSILLRPTVPQNIFVTYVCRNCGRTTRTYALVSYLAEDEENGTLFKFGESPPFGPPTPARVISLIGPEREYYLKGRRAESQGLGIAAFAYYRRVVENAKGRIFEEIIKVSQKISAPTDLIADLTAAQAETQFSKAVEVIRHGIPPALLINGHNPLRLLHSALSEGLHEQTDEQCLELATSIRVVLTELVDRLASALKEEAELTAAVARLVKAKAPQQQGSGDGE